MRRSLVALFPLPVRHLETSAGWLEQIAREENDVEGIISKLLRINELTQ